MKTPTDARRALFEEQLLYAQDRQRLAGRDIARWMDAIAALETDPMGWRWDAESRRYVAVAKETS